MERPYSESGPSPFIAAKLELLLSRYAFTYTRDGNRIEYFITDKESGEDISFSLVLTYNNFSRQVHVCKFYPGLYRQIGCRYLSAACFFLIVQHFGQQIGLAGPGSIFLQCRLPVYEDFYATLKDFAFHIVHQGQGDNVDVVSLYLPAAIDTSMIELLRENPL